jgi:hypothetical protein
MSNINLSALHARRPSPLHGETSSDVVILEEYRENRGTTKNLVWPLVKSRPFVLRFPSGFEDDKREGVILSPEQSEGRRISWIPFCKGMTRFGLPSPPSTT